jgi:hypothetical protein
MLVIGVSHSEKTKDKTVVHRELDIDPDVDSPRKIHDLLKKQAGGDFDIVVVIENDEVVETFANGEDYDLSEEKEMDDEDDETPETDDGDFVSSSDDDDNKDDFNDDSVLDGGDDDE